MREPRRRHAIIVPAADEALRLELAVGEDRRDLGLVAVEHVDVEMDDILDLGMDRGGLVDADEQARRVHRDDRDRGRGDPHRLAVDADRDDVHRRGDAAHRLLEGVGELGIGFGHGARIV